LVAIYTARSVPPGATSSAAAGATNAVNKAATKCWRMAFPRNVLRSARIVEGMDRRVKPRALSGPRRPHGLDRLRNRDRAARHLGMQPLDHAAFERNHAFALVLREIERRDDGARLRDLLGTRRKGRIGGRDLVWMDQRLAVEAHVACLGAL